jgi:outer membrane protein insertion porin family
MKFLLRFCGLLLLLALLPAQAQIATKVTRIDIKHVGPPSASDQLIRANIRLKPGDPYLPTASNEDVQNLYATGFFYNIRVTLDKAADGLVVTYVVQGKPKLNEIKFEGNTRFSNKQLKKKLTSKLGEPLDERKLFTDSQEMQKLYQKKGYQSTTATYRVNIEESAGRGTATFEIKESPKVKIVEVDFVGATAFSQRKLRKQVKTRKHWMFSWLTSHGYVKDEDLQEDREKLAEFYRDHGYIDFELKDVQMVNTSPRKMIVRFIVYEGTQYKVGSVKFEGNKLFTQPQMTNGFITVQKLKGGKLKVGPNGLPMDVGDNFTPKGFTKDVETVEDFYGARGYIDVNSSHGLNVQKIPNTESGTMDLLFQIDEGQKSFIEKVEIRGNTKTKDRVIRRELAVFPGETFDMLRVKLSKQRLEGLQYFEKVDLRPEPTEISPARKNLVVGVDEKNTGNLTLGAGFSSVDAVVGFVEVSQGNFDLFHPPTFTGAGQKFRLRVQVGTQRQDYLISFIEPWLFGHKLSFGTDLYYHKYDFQSLENLYDEVRAGGRLSLTKALGTENLIGSVSYTIEDVGILFNKSAHGPEVVVVPPTQGNGHPTFVDVPATAPQALLRESGYALLSKVGLSIAYDTRNSVLLPNKGQRTELSTEFAGGAFGGDKDFYKLELKTAWYFKGFFPGHVLEMVGRAGVADGYGGSDYVPFYERYYLGGLYSLRGFQYRSISPRETGLREPIGGDSYWFGSAEYSVPIFQQEKEGGRGVGVRFAVFYDVGNVAAQSYRFNADQFDDNWGAGIRLNLPIGPLRLDYGIPIHHDTFNGSSGRFQFGVGYTREF